MKRNKDRIKITWEAVALGAITLLMGSVMIIQGIEAYKTGSIIPPTTKSGPMTGMQSIITGTIAVCTGLAFLGNEVVKLIRRRKQLKKDSDE